MIRREIVLDAPREEVWEALTDPERLEDWFANDVELDLRPGGPARFRWENGEERSAVVEEVEEAERLRFRWEEDGVVEFTLEDADGATRLVVTESEPAWTPTLGFHAALAARV